MGQGALIICWHKPKILLSTYVLRIIGEHMGSPALVWSTDKRLGACASGICRFEVDVSAYVFGCN
jgi:hypothetical protein